MALNPSNSSNLEQLALKGLKPSHKYHSVTDHYDGIIIIITAMLVLQIEHRRSTRGYIKLQ